MYFYIDESGHSGTNLFDPNQPYLYYGILNSKFDLDNIAKQDILKLQNKLSVNELHANELGNGKLIKIIDDLEHIYQKYDINFDVCRLNKKDFAIISFFDQVFDQGANPTVPWTWYWTPLRYPLLLAIAKLFDDELAKQAWNARINTNSEKAQQSLVSICQIILDRANSQIIDKRLLEVITDALKWVIKQPSEIYYNVFDKDNILQVSPNIISFQSVLFLICYKIEQNDIEATKIIVDIQSEFNRTQDWITKLYQNVRKNSNEPLQIGPHMPSMDLSSMPLVDIDYKSGESIGLQLVDIHLWICKRFWENKKLALELVNFFTKKINSTQYNEISLLSISERWSKWFAEIPELTEKELESGRELHKLVEERRKPHIIK
ncbi:DUF3800 domain-containing protein [Actinobacillus vicugnae]|uniref:DUF3800 domain-containing protein n=1 Tax=Actinobacillus vicugnae TaxID=2573093 RepID=UPI00124203DA|nr:DUF3800 domain-containing protein [Actinobacillus vicugnae]